MVALVGVSWLESDGEALSSTMEALAVSSACCSGGLAGGDVDGGPEMGAGVSSSCLLNRRYRTKLS